MHWIVVLANLGFAAIMTSMSPRPAPKGLMFFWFFTLSAFALSTAFCVVNLVFCMTKDDGFGGWFTLFAGVAFMGVLLCGGLSLIVKKVGRFPMDGRAWIALGVQTVLGLLGFLGLAQIPSTNWW